MKKITGMFVLLLSGILILGCSLPGRSQAGTKEIRADVATLDTLPADERSGVEFLQKSLQAKNGIIYYLIDHGRPTSYSVLESMGQAMQYAALLGDNALLDEYASVTLASFYSDAAGYYPWKIDVSSREGETASAMIDDLRLAKAYLIAQKSAPDKYVKELQSLSEVMLRTDINKEDYPCDFYDSSSRTQADFVSLFYLDTAVMADLSGVDARWSKVHACAVTILQHMPENEYGFYPQSYGIAEKKYNWGDTINMVENLYTAIDASEAGKNTALFREFLKRQVKKKKLYNHYQLDGTPVDSDESTAVYALAARFLWAQQEKEAGDWCYKRMLDFQIDKKSAADGGFGDADTGTVYAFDQLEALLTMRMVNQENGKI